MQKVLILAYGDEQFLDDSMDAVSWYYKRDDYYLTYYKVCEENTKECLEITFEIVDGSIINISKEILKKTEIKNARKEETENN